MDLLKLIDELRTYRAQVEEAIAAMAELARRRELTGRDQKRSVKRAVKAAAKVRTRGAKRVKQPRPQHAGLRPKLVKPKRRRTARKSR